MLLSWSVAESIHDGVWSVLEAGGDPYPAGTRGAELCVRWVQAWEESTGSSSAPSLFQEKLSLNSDNSLEQKHPGLDLDGFV